MAIVSATPNQYISIIPSTGWSAVLQFRDDTGLVSQIFPVVCFALTIHGTVVPLVSTVKPEIVDITKERGYQGLYHSTESAYVKSDGTVVYINQTLPVHQLEEEQNG